MSVKKIFSFGLVLLFRTQPTSFIMSLFSIVPQRMEWIHGHLLEKFDTWHQFFLNGNAFNVPPLSTHLNGLLKLTEPFRCNATRCDDTIVLCFDIITQNTRNNNEMQRFCAPVIHISSCIERYDGSSFGWRGISESNRVDIHSHNSVVWICNTRPSLVKWKRIHLHFLHIQI